MFKSELHNCTPEYFRLEYGQYEHECELAYKKYKHYESNRKKIEMPKKLIISYWIMAAIVPVVYANMQIMTHNAMTAMIFVL